MNKKNIILEIMWQSMLGWNKCSGLMTEGAAVCQLCASLLNSKVVA